MTQTLELNKMGLTPLTKSEMLETNGGLSMEELMDLFNWSMALMNGSGMSSLSWTNIGDGLFQSNVGSLYYQFT